MQKVGGVIKFVYLAIIVISFLSITIPTISESLFGHKICKIDGCPNEALGGKFCYSHQCVNFNCHKKRADGFHYCEKCLEKAGYDLDY